MHVLYTTQGIRFASAVNVLGEELHYALCGTLTKGKFSRLDYISAQTAPKSIIATEDDGGVNRVCQNDCGVSRTLNAGIATQQTFARSVSNFHWSRRQIDNCRQAQLEIDWRASTRATCLSGGMKWRQDLERLASSKKRRENILI